MADSKPAVLDAAAASTLAGRADRVRPNVRLIGLLAAGHLVVDINQGSLPAILPFLKVAHGLSYAQAATIVLVASVASSIIQPVFGYFADRTARRWLLPAAVVTSGLGIALTGIAPGYGTVLALVLVMGVGIAAYHPEGFKTATSLAGERRATALSWFALGGNVGVAVGPPLITTLVTTVGVAGSLGLMIPSVVAGALLLAVLPFLGRATAAVAGRAASRGANMPRAMALLILVVMVRSWTQLGFTTFVPFYYVDHLQADPRVVGPLLFVFLGAGALGTLVAGPMADRFGPRPFMLWVFVAATPLGVLFLNTSGVVAFVVLGLFGAVLVSSFTVSVALGQAYMPRSAGMASGLIVGLAMGTGGLGVTVLGWVADRWGLPSALWISALLPLAAFALALFLPRPREAA
jgi:FSR family fosmidomycin resistance protein-like MFS transporter